MSRRFERPFANSQHAHQKITNDSWQGNITTRVFSASWRNRFARAMINASHLDSATSSVDIAVNRLFAYRLGLDTTEACLRGPLLNRGALKRRDLKHLGKLQVSREWRCLIGHSSFRAQPSSIHHRHSRHPTTLQFPNNRVHDRFDFRRLDCLPCGAAPHRFVGEPFGGQQALQLVL